MRLGVLVVLFVAIAVLLCGCIQGQGPSGGNGAPATYTCADGSVVASQGLCPNSPEKPVTAGTECSKDSDCAALACASGETTGCESISVAENGKSITKSVCLCASCDARGPALAAAQSLDMGATAKARGLEASVLSLERKEEFESCSALGKCGNSTAQKNQEFLFFSVKVLNASDMPYAVNRFQFSLMDGKGNEYSPNLGIQEEWVFASKALAKNGSEEASLGFEVPKDATGLKLYYNFDCGSPAFWNVS